MFLWLSKIKRTLKLEFTLLTSLLVMLIVLSISFYVMTFVKNLSQNASNQSLMLNETIARMVTEMAANSVKTNSLEKMQVDIENMMKVNERETYSLVNSFPKYTVHIGFYQDPVLVSSLDNFRKNLAGLVAIFICLGFLLSRLMVNMIIKPVNQLVESSYNNFIIR